MYENRFNLNLVTNGKSVLRTGEDQLKELAGQKAKFLGTLAKRVAWIESWRVHEKVYILWQRTL